MHKSSPSTCWEYKLVSMGNPLEPDTELRANTVGKQRWELAAIDAGVWVFKRPMVEESATGLQAIMEETVPITEPETVSAVSLSGHRTQGSGASYPTSESGQRSAVSRRLSAVSQRWSVARRAKPSRARGTCKRAADG